MLLNALSRFAHSRKILSDLAFDRKAIRWVVPLDSAGCLIGKGLFETAGETNRGKVYSAPITIRPKDAGGVAEFMADGITAVFGLDPEPEKKLTAKQRQARDVTNAKKNKWWVSGADGAEKAMGPDQFTFQVEGELPLLDEMTVRPYWRRMYAEEVAAKESTLSRGFCLVSGAENVSIAATNLPKIKRVPDTQSFGAAIVSFDKPSFTSYGFDQGLNAPISTESVAAYCNALNRLLNNDDHSLFIGTTVVCFWAEESKTESSFFASMLRKPDPHTVATFLKNPWAGIDRHAAGLDRFYSVTLSGNAGRIVVRHWMQSTVEDARQNFACWFKDLDMVQMTLPNPRARKRERATGEPEVDAGNDKDKMPPLAVFRLACTTVREAKDLQSEVPSQLYRAALEGTAPSIMLVKPILHRLKADLHHFGIKTLFNSVSRFALLRLILNRNRKEGEPMIECKVFETDDPAYNCGRLLAVLAEIQAKAFDYKLSGPGVAERYFGTASVSPSSVFPLLLRLSRHHIEKIRKTSGSTWNQENNIQQVVCKLAPDCSGVAPQFPRHLNLQAQGRFAIGFYQQKADVEMRKEAARKNKENTKLEPGHDQG
jgi:CRISPR-associated protein Csd1